MKLSKRELATALRRLSKAMSEAVIQRDLIADHCIEVYGKTAHDIDNDEFIDACDGGCGLSNSMTADEFHESMLDALKVNQRTV